MSQIGPTDQVARSGGRAMGRRQGRAPSDVYTVLALIALVALLFGIGFVWFYSQQLFGTQHPFELIETTRAGWAPVLGGAVPA